MSQVNRPEVPAIRQDTGDRILVEQGNGCTLLLNKTYLFVLRDADSPWSTVHLKWDAAIIFNAQYEDSDLPRKFGDGVQGKDDITDISLAKGDWMVETLPAAQVTVRTSDTTTGGAVYTAATGVLAVAGGTAGGAMLRLQSLGNRRGRLRVDVQGTGGVLRVCEHGKS